MSDQLDGALDDYGDVPEDDLAVLRQMVATGSDLTRPRLVEHFLYFPDEAHAAACAAGVKGIGWEAVVGEPPPGEDAWLVVARDPQRVLAAQTVIDDGALFAGAAAELGGVYDGWEAEN